MKVVLIHMGYFVALIILAFLSSFVIFGAGLGGGIDLYALLIPFVFSVFWLCDYIWRLLSISPNKIQLISPVKNWTFISLFLSGIFTVYSLFLTTWLFPGPFIIAVLLLLIWYSLLLGYSQIKSSYPQKILGSLLFIAASTFAYQICKIYILM